ncbi:hypothetical protein [Breoghania sp. L-A4]|uniref:hypothetical protein n=1 Tax=Breoghania sp. L-A4 TaxID=2304600 RepID=UPI0013C2B72B|nr:hypothetical protein [Breoghania sp. L-A4]
MAAAGLGIGGYQAGYFDSFKPMAENSGKGADTTAEKTVAAADLDAGAEPGKTQSVLPTFDIVRIEPTGDAVVAGLSEPKAVVALVANGAVVGKTTANTSGEWAIVLSKPLEPGDYDVAIQAASEDGKMVESTQRVTVSIPKSKTDDVLVVMNAEGEASTILQKPVAAQGELVVAQSDDTAASDKTRATAALQEKPAEAVAPAADTAATKTPASGTPAAESGPDAPASEAPAAGAPATGMAGSETAAPETVTTGSEPSAEPAPAAAQPAAETAVEMPSVAEAPKR